MSPATALAPCFELDLLGAVGCVLLEDGVEPLAVALSGCRGLISSLVSKTRSSKLLEPMAHHTPSTVMIFWCSRCAGTRTDERRSSGAFRSCGARVLHHRIVRATGGGHQHAHVYAASHGRAEGIDGVGFRNEVWVLNPDALACRRRWRCDAGSSPSAPTSRAWQTPRG